MANGSGEAARRISHDEVIARRGTSGRVRTPLSNLDDRLKALHAHTEKLRTELEIANAAGRSLSADTHLVDLETTVEELRVAEEELRVQNEELMHHRHDLEGALSRYQELFELAPDAYFVTDAAGIVREANGAAARLLGVPASRLMGKPLAQFVAAGEHRRFRSTITRLAAGEKPHGADTEWMVTLKPRHSEAVEAACTVAAVHDSSGHLLSLRWLLRDVTARRRAEGDVRALNAQLEQRVQERTAALEAANWAKSEFLAVMAHELRTPLNAILGYTELLEMGLPGPVTEGQISHLARIRSGGMRLVSLIDEVLDLGKVEAGQLRVVHDELPIAAAVNSSLALLMPRAAARGVRLENECVANPDLCYIGDQTRVEQILINLLSNAIKFTESGGSVRIACEVRATAGPNVGVGGGGGGMGGRGGWLVMTVADTGIGMPPEVLSRVFDPFIQVESPLTRTRGGTGLGLTISRRLARLMGGDLIVESRVNEGSKFSVWLPLASVAAAKLQVLGERRGPERYAKGIAELGTQMFDEVDSIIRKYAKQLSGKSGVRAAGHLSRSELEDHAAAFVTDIVQSLVVVEDDDGGPSAVMRDGTALRRLISERHGAQRQRLGWTEDDLEREFSILRAAVFAALRRVARNSAKPELQKQRSAAQSVIAKLLDKAEETSLRGYRSSTRQDSRNEVPTG